jgi:hypothetical protein
MEFSEATGIAGDKAWPTNSHSCGRASGFAGDFAEVEIIDPQAR